MPEELAYEVAEWTDDGQHVYQVLARAYHREVADAAYAAALKVRPDRWIKLRYGAMLLDQREPASNIVSMPRAPRDR